MARTKYGISPWIDTFPKSRRREYPRLRGDHTATVVIVGGGLTGCCTAYALAAAGVRPVVVEADRVGLAGAGRSAGFISGDAASSYRDLEAAHGRRAARAMFEASRRASLDLAATARRLGIKAAYEPRAALCLAAPFGEEKRLRREVEARRAAGLDAVWVGAAALARDARLDAPGAMRLRDWGQVDPYRLTLGFAKAAVERGAILAERTGVRRLKMARRHVDVHLDGGGTIAAETVIVCTDHPGALFPSLRRHVAARERYAVLTEPMPPAMRREMGVSSSLVRDVDRPPHTIGWTSDHRLLVTGADQPRTSERGREKVLVQRTGQLMYELSRLFPAMSGLPPGYGWDMPVAATADEAMFAGPHRNYPRHLFAWGTGHDPARAFLASRILLRHVLGTAEKSDLFFAFTRG